MSRNYRFDTLAIHAGQPDEALTGAVVLPVFQTTTYAQQELGGVPPYCYSRTGNPSRAALESSLAALEGGRFGLAFASGIAAANALLQTLAAGDHVVASQDLYGGCYRLFTKIFSRFGVEFSLIDATKPGNVAAALTPRTRLVWLETPSNPLLRITDIRACAAIAHEHGVYVVVDNTFATPVFQRPLELGADLVLHSTTKYIGGHSDVLGGALVTSNESLYQTLKFVQNATGAVPAPWDCFLLLRGIRTLRLRVQQHARSALLIARYLERHPDVRSVIFPGLSSHPQHELAARQGTGYGAIVSVEFRGGRERIHGLVRELELWPLAESLGGVKSLLCHPASMTHAAVDPAERARVGITEGLLRLSVGLEDPADLIEDLERALQATGSLNEVEEEAQS